jgi:transposase-like protein
VSPFWGLVHPKGMGHPKGQKRDFDALERRRMEALRLFRKGIPQAQIARQLKVARQTVSRWVRQYREGGKAALRKAAAPAACPSWIPASSDN